MGEVRAGARGLTHSGDVTRIDRHRLDDHRVHGTITSPESARWAMSSTTSRLGLVGHLAEDRVLAVEVRLRADGDEELRAVRAGPGVGHGQQVRLVEDQIGMDFVVRTCSPDRRCPVPSGQPP